MEILQVKKKDEFIFVEFYQSEFLEDTHTNILEWCQELRQMNQNKPVIAASLDRKQLIILDNEGESHINSFIEGVLGDV